MTCPFCDGEGAHSMSGGGVCLDCDRTWVTKSQRRVAASSRRMDWFDRLNDPSPDMGTGDGEGT